VDARRAPSDAAREATDALRQTGTHLMGGILNRCSGQAILFSRFAA
jgi:hypothetical protein